MPHEFRPVAAARMIELGREESLALLAGVHLGRIGSTERALPVTGPVSHLVDGDSIIIHTGFPLLDHIDAGELVVYEADHLDARTRTGWSVMASGAATATATPLEAARYRRLLIPWVQGDTKMNHVVRIHAEIVTGYRLAR